MLFKSASCRFPPWLPSLLGTILSTWVKSLGPSREFFVEGRYGDYNFPSKAHLPSMGRYRPYLVRVPHDLYLHRSKE